MVRYSSIIYVLICNRQFFLIVVVVILFSTLFLATVGTFKTTLNLLAMCLESTVSCELSRRYQRLAHFLHFGVRMLRQSEQEGAIERD